MVLLMTAHMRAQVAQVQFIHNSADTTIAEVDIWINSALWSENIAYHEATPMMSAVANEVSQWELRNSNDSTEILFSWTAQLPPTSKHIFVLHGVNESLHHTPFQPLSVAQFDTALELSASASSIDVLFFQGSTDLDTVDIAETQLFELTAFDQLAYGAFSGYVNLFTADYGWSILDTEGNTNLGEFSLPISSLNWAGKAITIVSGGFYNQTNNNNGQALGLWATTRDGGPMVCLQPIQWNLSANVQFLHNSALPAAQSVRIETDGNLWQSNLQIHEATPFLPFPAGKDVVVRVNSNLLGSPMDSIWCDTLHLYSGGDYQLYWFGGESSQSPARLLIHSYENASEIDSATAVLRLFNGTSLWPEISLLADTLTQSVLFQNVPYGGVSDTISLPLQHTEWLIYALSDSITALQAPLDTLGYEHRNLTALTFLEANNSIPDVWLSTELGGAMHRLSTLVIAPNPIFCEVQFVHASADTLLQSIDVWLGDSLVYDQLNFETATPFISLQCNDPLQLRITRHNETTTALHSDTIALQASQKHRLILWGIEDTEQYNPSPALRWHVANAIETNASNPSEFDLDFFHAATDLGSVTINEISASINPLWESIESGGLSSTQTLNASVNYGIELRNTPTQFLYQTYALPSLTNGWQQKAITLLSTGFRQPANNSGGQSMQLWALEPSGNMTELTAFVGVEKQSSLNPLTLFPNPTQEFLTIRASSYATGLAQIQFMDLMGKVVFEDVVATHEGRIDALISIDFLPVGYYHACIQFENSVSCSPFTIAR